MLLTSSSYCGHHCGCIAPNNAAHPAVPSPTQSLVKHSSLKYPCVFYKFLSFKFPYHNFISISHLSHVYCPSCSYPSLYHPDIHSSSSLFSLIFHHCQHSVSANHMLLFQVPLFIPVLVIAVALFLCLLPIITDPSPRYFIAPVLIGLACILYVPLIYYKFQPEWISKYFYW